MTFSEMFNAARAAENVQRATRRMALEPAARFASASSWPNRYIFRLYDDTGEATIIGWAPMESYREARNEDRAEFVDGISKHGDADRVVARIKILNFSAGPFREYMVTG